MNRQSPSSRIPFEPAPELVVRVHSSLLRWYAAEQRNLPWRSTQDAYAILVSEIMLQQTQVERVLPKYQQFLAAFPTLADLAAASTAEVISVWVPLGYNRRAVSLQSIARQVMAEYDGRIPESIDELLKLKGVGRYTAGAIACFAYRKQVATVDTNIRRVLQRIFLGLEHSEPKLNDVQAHDLLIRALDNRAITVTQVSTILQEWRTPRHPEFAADGKTAWRFFNAVTEAAKGSGLWALPQRT